MAGGGAEHPGILYFYGEAVGLGTNGACAFAAALANLGAVPRDGATGALFLTIGGAVQLLCSFRAFRAHDHFGATVLGFYAALWAVLGLELLFGSDIHLLHASLLVVGVCLTLVAPLVNAYYTILLSAIAVASSLELAIRLVDEMGTVEIATAVAELVVVVVASYGVASAILHGIHERQVLPGFDDALVETVLWKRRALKSKYSDGKWADPLPLGSVCRAMGFAGIAYDLQRKENEPWEDDLANNGGLSLWHATFAVLLGAIYLLHCLRHERIWVVSSVCDVCLFATFVVGSSEHNSVDGGIFIAFAVVRLYILGFALAEGFSLVHVATFLLQAISLLVIGIASFSQYVERSNALVASALFYATALSVVYSGIAELANSIAQKILLPIGQDFSFMGHCCKNTPSDKKWRSKLLSNSTHTAQEEVRCTVDEDEEDDEESPAFSRRTFIRMSLKLLSAYTNNYDAESDYKYPGDHNLPGHSDFQSPLFVMITGTAFYSIIISIGVLASSNQAIFDAALMLSVTQALSLLICALRGMTCFGFLSFTYVLEGIILLAGGGASPNLVAVLMLRATWLLSSFGVFRLLSFAALTHLIGLVSYLISGVDEDRAAPRVLSGVFFILTSITSLVTLGLLLGSEKLIICRLLLQHSSADTEELCGIGFASDRAQFDECVNILKEGGVCCIPTDTVYCLACAANSPDAIKRIYAIKNRPAEKPLSLWLGSIEDIKNVSPEGKGWTPKLFAFMDAIWPGSVSLVVSRGSWLQRMGVGDAADLIGTPDSIALRVPNSTLTVALLRETGPLAITSANPSGACDCTHHNKVDDVIASKIDYILADGASPMTIASSVVDVRDVESNELFFYRVGCVPESYIWSKLKDSKPEAPLVVEDIHRAKARTIASFMSQIIKLVGCNTYRIYMLISEDGDHPTDTSDIVKTPWEIMPSPVRDAFLSGVPHYGRQGEDDQLQMLVPMRNTQGRVIAVLQLLDKVSNGSPIPFKKDDLAYANLVSALLCENISITTNAKEEAQDWTQVTKAVVLSECGLVKERKTDRPGLHPRRHSSMDLRSRSMERRSSRRRSRRSVMTNVISNSFRLSNSFTLRGKDKGHSKSAVEARRLAEWKEGNLDKVDEDEEMETTD